jgi:cytochrome c biogenesis protein CcmG/thiol:disulfide interchange protein DsbE
VRRTALALAFALLGAAGCSAHRPSLVRSWVVGKPLDLGLTTLNGEPVAVGGATGRVRVLVLWASWCNPCFRILPALDVVATGADGRGLQILAISVDEDVEKAREALPRVPSSLRILWDRGAERLGERLGVEELPTFVVLDRNGLVRHVHEGSDDQVVELVDREIRRLLQE